MPADRRSGIQRGFGTAERPVIGELWQRDRGRDSVVFESGNYEPNYTNVNYERYYDPLYFQRELKTVWSKSWLFACREEDIPAIGDRTSFDVGPLSVFIVHSAENDYKAFYNSCLHRGTALCSGTQSGASIRCPYHGWEWSIDGRLRKIPSHWDFAEINKLNGSLPEVKISRWNGFIFVNFDPDAAALEATLQIIPEHLKGFAYQQRYTAARFKKHVRANWKIAQEAFMEAYHLYATHPEAAPFTADAQTQYDIWRGPFGSVGRNAAPGTIPSIFASPDATLLAAAQAYAMTIRDWHFPDLTLPELDPSRDLREQVASWHRAALEQHVGHVDDAPDAIMTDSLLYFVLPHSTFWLSEAVPFTYQFTPHPTNPEQSFFEVRLMRRCPTDQPRPPSSPVIHVGPDETVADKAPAFSFLAYVFDQDMANMPLIQKGVRAADPNTPIPGLDGIRKFSCSTGTSLLIRRSARPKRPPNPVIKSSSIARPSS